MKYYYKLKDDGSIGQVITFAEGEVVPSDIADGWIKTDKKIIRTFDGSFKFADDVDVRDENIKKREFEEKVRLSLNEPSSNERIEALEETVVSLLETINELTKKQKGVMSYYGEVLGNTNYVGQGKVQYCY